MMEIKPLGDNALVVEFDHIIDPDILIKVINLQKSVEGKNLKGIIEMVPAYSSLAIYYDPLIISYEDIKQRIISNSENISIKAETYSAWKIPVCYDSSLAFDLEEFIITKGISKKQLVQLHTQVDYLVYMRGFLPGFLYLGGLNEQLYCKRKATPSPKVPEGSVAIGGQQTGIYSFPSPGGWHIIGKTPIKLFHPSEEQIMKVAPGDIIRFYSISVDEFNEIKKEVDSGRYLMQKEK